MIFDDFFEIYNVTEKDKQELLARYNVMIRELNLYKQALTKSVSLPKGVLPHENGKYYTCMLGGNCVVKEEN